MKRDGKVASIRTPSYGVRGIPKVEWERAEQLALVTRWADPLLPAAGAQPPDPAATNASLSPSPVRKGRRRRRRSSYMDPHDPKEAVMRLDARLRVALRLHRSEQLVKEVPKELSQKAEEQFKRFRERNSRPSTALPRARSATPLRVQGRPGTAPAGRSLPRAVSPSQRNIFRAGDPPQIWQRRRAKWFSLHHRREEQARRKAEEAQREREDRAKAFLRRGDRLRRAKERKRRQEQWTVACLLARLFSFWETERWKARAKAVETARRKRAAVKIGRWGRTMLERSRRKRNVWASRVLHICLIAWAWKRRLRRLNGAADTLQAFLRETRPVARAKQLLNRYRKHVWATKLVAARWRQQLSMRQAQMTALQLQWIAVEEEIVAEIADIMGIAKGKGDGERKKKRKGGGERRGSAVRGKRKPQGRRRSSSGGVSRDPEASFRSQAVSAQDISHEDVPRVDSALRHRVLREDLLYRRREHADFRRHVERKRAALAVFAAHQRRKHELASRLSDQPSNATAAAGAGGSGGGWEAMLPPIPRFHPVLPRAEMRELVLRTRASLQQAQPQAMWLAKNAFWEVYEMQV